MGSSLACLHVYNDFRTRRRLCSRPAGEPLLPTVPPLAEQTVLITGAAQGLGRALALAFSTAGASLALVDKHGGPLDRLARSLPRAEAYGVDLSEEEETRTMIAGLVARHPRIDTLIHNAGFLRPQPFASMPDALWRRTFNVGIQAAWLLTRALWPRWQASGAAAIYVSSRSGIEGFAEEAPYCATKHALEGLVKALALRRRGAWHRPAHHHPWPRHPHAHVGAELLPRTQSGSGSSPRRWRRPSCTWLHVAIRRSPASDWTPGPSHSCLPGPRSSGDSHGSQALHHRPHALNRLCEHGGRLERGDAQIIAPRRAECGPRKDQHARLAQEKVAEFERARRPVEELSAQKKKPPRGSP